MTLVGMTIIWESILSDSMVNSSGDCVETSKSKTLEKTAKFIHSICKLKKKLRR